MSAKEFCTKYFALLYLLFVLPWISLGEFGGSSEAREAHVIQTIVEHGEWILPTRNGIVPSKPPLFHWSGAIVSSLVGEVSPFTVRLTSLLFAVGILLLVRRTFAAIVISTTYLFFSLSMDGRVDMAFAFFCTGAILSALRAAEEEPERSALWSKRIGYFWLWAAGAVLTKGPLGVALPLIVVACCIGKKRLLTPTWGWLVFFLLVVGWYWAATLVGGEAFLQRQILFENIKRITGDVRMNSEAPWFYLREAPRVFLPWFVILLLAVWRSGVSTGKNFLLWLGLGIALFSLASGKRPSYLLPLVPAMALYLDNWWQREKLTLSDNGYVLQRRVAGVLELLAIFFLVAILAFCELSPFFSGLNTEENLVREWIRLKASYIQLFLLISFLVIYIIRIFNRAVSLSLAWLTVFAVCIGIGYGIKGYAKGFDLIADRINGLNPQYKLYAFRPVYSEYLDPILYYLNRQVTIIDNEQKIDSCDGVLINKIGSDFSKKLPVVATFSERLKKDRGVEVYDCGSYS